MPVLRLSLTATARLFSNPMAPSELIPYPFPFASSCGRNGFQPGLISQALVVQLHFPRPGPRLRRPIRSSGPGPKHSAAGRLSSPPGAARAWWEFSWKAGG